MDRLPVEEGERVIVDDAEGVAVEVVDGVCVTVLVGVVDVLLDRDREYVPGRACGESEWQWATFGHTTHHNKGPVRI